MERLFRIFLFVIFVLRSPWARADVGPGPIGNFPGPVLPADTITSSDGLGYVGGAGSVTAGGEYSWSLPLWVPDGKGGLKPGLSIQYGSRGGNGLLGVGFSLSGLSAISRCGQTMAVDGVTRGVDFSYEDRFCLDGQRLVLIDGSYGVGGSEYRTERESYQRILYSEGNIFEPGSFEIHTKEGLHLRYEGIKGNRAKPSLVPPHPLEVVERVDVLWVLKSIQDRSGNEIAFNYQVISPPNSFVLEYVPESIVYGKRSVHFVYEDRLDPSFSWLSGIKLKNTKILKKIEMHAPNPDAIALVQSYEFDYLYSFTTHRSLLHTINRCDFEHTCLWAKEFKWETGNRPNFTTIDLPQHDFISTHFQNGLDTSFLVLDMDGDGSDELLYRKNGTYFVGHKDPNDPSVPLKVEHELTEANTKGPSGEYFRNIDMFLSRPFDLEGDGAMELWGAQWVVPEAYVLFQWDANSLTPRATDTGFVAPVIISGQNMALAALQLGDLDGDGLTDMMLQDFMPDDTPFWNFIMNEGAAPFSPLFTWAPAFYGYQAKVIDVEGDGRAEVMNSADTGKKGTNTAGLNPDNTLRLDPVLDLPYTERNALMADVNGDGIRDIVHLGDYQQAGWVRFGAGTGYDERKTMLNGPLRDGNISGVMDGGTAVADINSDGRDDFLCFRYDPWPGIFVYLSNGDGSFHSEQIQGWPGHLHNDEGFSTSRIGDFNGDGLVDLVLVSPNLQLRVLEQTPGPVDVVIEVGDQFVGEYAREKIFYSEHWSDKPKAASCVFPQRCIKHGMTVVREHWLWQGERVNEYRKLAYEYQDPRMDMHGRGFLGFGKFVERDLDRWSQTITTFDHATSLAGKYPYAGLPKTVEHIAPIFEEAPNAFPFILPARRTLTVYDYAMKPKSFGLTYEVEPEHSYSFEYELEVSGNAPFEVQPIAGSEVLMRQRGTKTAFDPYGNLELQERWTVGGVYEKTSLNYLNDGANWKLGLLLSSDFVSAQDGANALPQARHTEYGYYDNGLLKTIWVEPNASQDNQKLTTTLVRDGDGLVTQVIHETPGLPARNLFIAYDDIERIYPVSVWNDLGFTTQYRHHPGLGVLGAVWDMHGVESRMQYNGFGRLVHSERTGEPSEDLWASVSLKNGFVNGLILQSATTNGDESLAVIDELGRPVAQGTKAFDGQWSFSKQRYDLLGRVVEAWRPDFGALSQYSSKFLYDSLDRLLLSEAPDGVKTSIGYSFFETEITDPDQHISRQVVDVDGRIWKGIDVLDGQDIVTEYRWGDFGRIHEVMDHKGNVTGFLYDQRGRRTFLSDPDRGNVDFLFNGFDELVWEKNALQQETSYERDLLGRTKNIINVDGTTHFEWDAHLAGQLAWAISPDGTRRDFLYDSYGRLESSIWMIKGEKFALDFAYENGRVSRIDYPEVPGRQRFGVEFGYNARNYLEEVRDAETGEAYWTVQARNAEGALESGRFGQVLNYDRSYDPVTGRLNAIQSNNGQLIDSIAYKYWPGGDVRSREDALAGRNEEFLYDDIGRLQSWTLNTQSISHTTAYGFDELGNLEHLWRDNILQEDNGYGLNNTKPHALTSTVKGPYSYDAIGRMTQGGGRDIAYTAFDLPSSITQNGMTTTLAYDAFHERVRKTGPLGDTIFVGEMYERREGVNGFEHVFFVPGEFGPAAEVHFNQTTQKEKILYLPGDALGSLRVVTDAGGKEIDRAYFEPFGQRIDENGTPIVANPNMSPEVHWGFTGYQHDYELGLIHARGRTYDPITKHFLTPDPIVSNPLFGQTLNRYAYAFGNPLRYTDPSGFDGCGDDPKCSLSVKAPPGLDAPVAKRPAAPAASKSKAAETPTAAAPEPPPAAIADSDGAKPVTGAVANSKTASPDSKTSTEAPVWEGPAPPGLIAAQPRPLDREAASGMALGIVQGVTPFGTSMDGLATAGGLGYRGSPRYQFAKSFGQAIGGLALTLLGTGGTLGGMGLNLSGIGAAVGVPAVALSFAIMTAGTANVIAGVNGMWQSLTTGGGAGPPGVSAGPAPPTAPVKAAPDASKNLRVVNSKMGHAAARAVERAGFESIKEATDALRAFGQNIEKNGLPANTVKDSAGHLIVPGFGNGGAVVYRLSDGKLTLQTVLNYVEGKGTVVGSSF